LKHGRELHQNLQADPSRPLFQLADVGPIDVSLICKRLLREAPLSPNPSQVSCNNLVLASAVPLAIAAVFARGGPRPCIGISGTAVQLASGPWQAQLHVSFTDDVRLATVRVQISDSAEAADFTVIDDIDDAEQGACESNAPPQLVAISRNPSASEPVIYLSQDGPADYRIFCALEELFAARRLGVDRRRPRRSSPARGGIAVRR
jgi:hypothetical protein